MTAAQDKMVRKAHHQEFPTIADRAAAAESKAKPPVAVVYRKEKPVAYFLAAPHSHKLYTHTGSPGQSLDS
jgi:hypothetical protein